MKFSCRIISEGVAEGIALVSNTAVSLLGDIDEKGLFTVGELKGESVAGKVLIFPYGRGSTVGSYTLLRLKKKGLAPSAIINKESEPIIAIGAIIAEIPLVDFVSDEFFSRVKSGDKVYVNAVEGFVEIK
ncbi:MAG: DUF126 domain-containing protein [Archaeoglobaceae archaeon]